MFQLSITLAPRDARYLWANSSFEQYVPANLSAEGEPLAAPIRMRPCGFSTLFTQEVRGWRSLPFVLDFAAVDPAQRFFGMERARLRSYGDKDLTLGLREWLGYRTLRAAGLPHVRTRFVTLAIDGEHAGLYQLLESPMQEHVFAHAFPDYDPENFQLYKAPRQHTETRDFPRKCMGEREKAQGNLQTRLKMGCAYFLKKYVKSRT